MDAENQGEGRSLSAIDTSCNSMCLDMDAQSMAAKEMYTTGDENEPKARKPYTITKQRERWTEDEHKKFLEALKLYGRAWRRIEEHVGTKTAVQIRSHAQKFFSKVVRESSNTEASPVKAIEIPPPRPKRKPMHPYPRKQVQTVDRRIAVPQQLERSPSPNSPVSEQENQSPKSVLSAVGSDTLGSTVSNHQNGSQSPVSSADYAKPSSLLTSRKDDRCCQASTSLTDEENGSPSTFATSGSSAQEQSSMTCDFGSKDKGSKEESQSVEAPTMSLKLFGRTVLVTDSLRPSSSLTGTGKALAAEGNQESLVTDKLGPVHSVQKNPMDSTYSMASNINTWNTWPYGNPSTLYQTQFRNEKPKQAVEGSSVVPMPWWSMQGGLPFPVLTPLKVNAVQMPSNAHCSEPSEEESDDQDKEGSSTGSSTSSDDVADTNNQELSSDKNPSQGYVLKPSKRSAFSPLTANPSKCIKGFVPYKRCLAEREDEISKIAGEEREGQRIRLCL